MEEDACLNVGIESPIYNLIKIVSTIYNFEDN
jgi:hypothetical protein